MPAVLNDVFRFEEQTMVDDPNVNVEAFCNMLQLAQQPLYKGCSTHNELSAMMRLLSIKLEHKMSN